MLSEQTTLNNLKSNKKKSPLIINIVMQFSSRLKFKRRSAYNEAIPCHSNMMMENFLSGSKKALICMGHLVFGFVSRLEFKTRAT